MPMESEISLYRKDYEKNCTKNENGRTIYKNIKLIHEDQKKTA